MDQKDQVKDYYKILGVKPIASPEEIHARWIELMRKFHPDRGKYEALEDERAREINEAYGVLKDSSSRSEYDLRRAYQRKKKSLYLQRVITPPAVFIILLILALVYLQRPGSVRPAKSSLPSTRGSIQNKTNPLSSPVVNELNLPNQTNPNEIDQTNQTNETNQIDKIDQTNQIDQRKSPRHPNPTPTSKSQQSPHIKTRTNQTNETDEIDETNQTDQTDQTNQIIQPLPMSVSKERKAYPLFAKAKTSVTINNATPSPGEPSHRDKINLINQTNQTDQIDGTDEIDQIDQIDQIAALDSLTEPDFLKAPNQPNLIAETDQIDQITEEEVRQFLEHYRDRYVHEDIDGFLSLFSSKAVQNGREGFDEIKKIYSDFFHQSHEIQYHLEDTRIEIYQEVLISGLFYEHAALVEARYQVDQTLAKKGEKRVWRGDIRWILVRENGALKILYLRFKHKESH